MSDIFFSYSSKDRERVRVFHDALVARGFTVFWDQAVPTGTDWDTWIRRQLNDSKCALVAWSAHSVVSDNVRHEATIARQQNKLVPMLLEALTPDQFPMGLYAVQGANLPAWSGDTEHPEWLKLLTQIEAKLMPPWVGRKIDTLDAELVAERTRREAAESRAQTLREQIAKEAKAQQDLRHERDQALHDIGALKARIEPAGQPNPQVTELLQRLRTLEVERDRLAQEAGLSRDKVAALERTIDDLRKKRRSSADQPETVSASADFPRHGAVPDNRRTARAITFAAVMPFLLIGMGALFGSMRLNLFGPSSTDGGMVTGLLLTMFLVTAFAILQLRREGTTGHETALYWLGCGIAGVAALTALAYGVNPTSRSSGPVGLEIGSLLALLSGGVVAGRRGGKLSGVEIALFWVGASLALAGAVFALILLTGSSWFGPYEQASTGFFAAAAVVLLSGMVMLYRRRAVLRTVDGAIYWAGCSLALVAGIPAFFVGTGLRATAIPVGLPIAALVSAAMGLALYLALRKRGASKRQYP